MGHMIVGFKAAWRFAFLVPVLVAYLLFIAVYALAYGLEYAINLHCFLWVDGQDDDAGPPDWPQHGGRA